MTVRDSSGNPFIDFVWGNMPMQPNDDRGEATLDPTLDSHIIAASNYEGFPEFIQGTPYDDTITNVTVPNLVGVTNPTVAQSVLTSAGLVLRDTNGSTTGATSGNNLHVKSQSPAAGTLVNLGDSVDIVVYNYVPTSNPIAGIRYNAGLNMDERYMYLVGRSSGLHTGDYITISGCDVTDYNRPYQVRAVVNDDSFNTGGTKVTIANGIITSHDPSTGHGTWVTGVH